MNDPFLDIHELLHKGNLKIALETLYNKKNGDIYKKYKSDENHAWYIIGDIFFKSGNYEMAVHSFKRALESREDDIEAYCALANSYSAMNRPEKSAYALLAALKYAPQNPTINYNLGNAYFDMGRYREALEHYNKITLQHEEIYGMAQKNITKAKNLVRLQK